MSHVIGSVSISLGKYCSTDHNATRRDAWRYQDTPTTNFVNVYIPTSVPGFLYTKQQQHMCMQNDRNAF